MTFTDTVKFRGVGFEWGDEILIVPPLPLGQSKNIQKKMAALATNLETETKEEAIEKMDQRIAIIVEAATLALRRNYPDISDDVIADFVNQGNMNDVFSASLYGSIPSQSSKTLVEAKSVLEKKLNPNE